jgi:zinc transport system substrate-binding protein
LVLFATACAGRTDDDGARPRVVASFYPLAFVVEEVGGALVELENLTPPGAEPHDLELTAGQIRALADSDLVVYVGEGFQPSVEDTLGEIDSSVIDVLDTQRDLLEATTHQDEDDQGHEGDEHEGEMPVDPHVWLDPERLGLVADAVTERLTEIDPDNAERFRSNARRLQSLLSTLDAQFRNGLARCERSTIVTSHEAFGYLADAYALEEIGITGIDPEAEPSPRRLAEITEFVEENDVTTVFFEVLVPPQTAETLAEEAGIQSARLDPLEGPPEAGDYFAAMRANLDALRRGLDCE